MPVVPVRLFAAAAAEYGADDATAQGTTVAEALADLCTGASARAVTVIGRSSLLVNAVACRDPEQELHEGDRIDVLPPFAGG